MIFEKINRVMRAVHGVGKARRNKHANYDFASHEDVTEALRGQFVSVGIVRYASMLDYAVTDTGTLQMTVRVSYVDIEDSSRVDVDMPAIQPSQTSNKTPTAQQVGQALSYAVKNVEFKLFSLTGDPEPDADSLPIERGAGPEGIDPLLRPLISRLRSATTAAGVASVTESMRVEWPSVSTVPRAREILVAERLAAIERVASASREPGEEG